MLLLRNASKSAKCRLRGPCRKGAEDAPTKQLSGTAANHCHTIPANCQLSSYALQSPPAETANYFPQEKWILRHSHQLRGRGWRQGC